MTRPAEIEAFEQAHLAKITKALIVPTDGKADEASDKKAKGKRQSKTFAATEIPQFRAGDSLRVQVRIREGETERLQAFEGVCIARHNAGLGSSFTVRKRSYGEGVERVFPLHSPNIATIEIVQRGQVRRAKLYYLRDRQGKRARIAEDITRAREDRTQLADKKQEKAMQAKEGSSSE